MEMVALGVESFKLRKQNFQIGLNIRAMATKKKKGMKKKSTGY
jgi:hypothetical protein